MDSKKTRLTVSLSEIPFFFTYWIEIPQKVYHYFFQNKVLGSKNFSFFSKLGFFDDLLWLKFFPFKIFKLMILLQLKLKEQTVYCSRFFIKEFIQNCSFFKKGKISPQSTNVVLFLLSYKVASELELDTQCVFKQNSKKKFWN